MRTTNGGLNWEYIYNNVDLISEIFFLNMSRGFAVTSPLFVYDDEVQHLLTTSDGGYNWDTLHTFPWINSKMDIHFRDDLNGFVTGANNENATPKYFANPIGISHL
jgi:photosystem II stability/assembly factor-like uncharacterized protein